MKKIEKIGYVVVLGIIVFLLLASSTDMIFKESSNKVYTVAVILNDKDDQSYVNCKKGMEKASEIYNIDITYKTLYDPKSQLEQEELMIQAVENGANAIVITPIHTESLERSLSYNQITVPVISLKAKLENERVESSITGDYEKMAKLLANQLLENNPIRGKTVRVFAMNPKVQEVKSIFQSMEEYMSDAKVKLKLQPYTKEVNSFLKEDELVVALDQEVLTQLSQNNKTNRIYGVGYDSELLQGLKEDKLQSLVIYNEYDMGYLGMEHAVDLINRKVLNKHTQLEPLVIQPQDVYKEEYEPILFPIS